MPIKVDQGYGPNWGSMDEIEFTDDEFAAMLTADASKQDTAATPVKAEVVIGPTPATPPIVKRVPTSIFISIEGLVETRVITDLQLLFGEYVGELCLQVEYSGAIVNAPYKVSDRLIPEVRRLRPRAIVQLRDSEGRYIIPG